MNCVEFERVLADYLEGGHTKEQQAHLDSCPACSGLLTDLELISSQAKLLLGSDEPSPAVWNVIEAQLRSEGIIRRSVPAPVPLPRISWWRNAWLVPVAAALALVAGLKLYHPARAGDNAPIAKVSAPVASPAAASVSREDQQLLSTVSSRPPAQQARYRADLNDANSFIRDAEQSMKDDPNDIYTQQMLINAYTQKQMLYELAVDREGGQ
jgi:hypothetical protein